MLIAYQVSLEVAKELVPVIATIRKHDNDLAKQLMRAMSSTVQNLAEGMVLSGGNKRHKYELAWGEANEVRGSLDVAKAWGYILDDSVARKPVREHVL